MKKKKQLNRVLLERSDNICELMGTIISILKENNYKFTTNIDSTEIVVQDNNIKEIKDLFEKEIDIPIDEFSVLIYIKKSNNNIYIRQRVI